ncbi:MAG: hypothetical protein LBL62_09890 [Planctomycetaceae bacterium]|jgi:hypothetical protein|nr:hypothetical protein [Planctomycetaceae bacterium]
MNRFHILPKPLKLPKNKTADCPDFRQQRQEEKITLVRSENMNILI